jgi:predicted RNase H-like HicB family nuclease
MKIGNHTAIVERCPATRLYIGYVLGIVGAHSQGATLEQLRINLTEILEFLLNDANALPTYESDDSPPSDDYMNWLTDEVASVLPKGKPVNRKDLLNGATHVALKRISKIRE